MKLAKPLIISFFLALLTVCYGQPFTVSNKIGSTITPAALRRQVLEEGRVFYGSSDTDGANAYQNPNARNDEKAAYGINHTRLHHAEPGVWNGWYTVDQITANMDSGVARGIRYSFGLCDKLGELSPHGLKGFQIKLLDQDPEAEELYKANIKKFEKVLKHRGLFLVCLTNEVAHLTTPEKAKRFWEKWAPVVRQINPNLLLTDSPDAWDRGPAWDSVISLYDVMSVHFYGGGEDFGPNGGGNWITEGWRWRDFMWARDRIRTIKPKMPIFFQEFGSYAGNPTQGSNEVFLLTRCIAEGYSTCSFAWRTNDGGTDRYAVTSDPMRLNLTLFGAYLFKNKVGLKTTYWGGEILVNGAWQWSPRYEASGDKCEIDQDSAQIGSYVFSWGKSKRLWLSKALSPLVRQPQVPSI